ncbi:hypothetical protein Tco_0104579 [Tanacetum coccineum]
MTGHRSKLINFVSMFIRTVQFGNDHFAAIMGYGDLQIGNILISHVYYIEGLGHNLFFVGQFCDSDLEVAFRKHTCFVRNLEGVDLLLGSHGFNLYAISMENMMKSFPISSLTRLVALNQASASTSAKPPTMNDCDLLFQPMFYEYFKSPSAVSTPISAATLLLTDTAEPTSSSSIDKDAPSPSTSPNIDAINSPINSTNVEPNKEVWGCKALVKHDTPDKLKQRSVKCIFIGYPNETMGYYFYFPPENKIVVVRFVRTHRSHERLCLNVEIEEHSLGDLNELTNYKAALLYLESAKWLDAMNTEMQSIEDNQV